MSEPSSLYAKIRLSKAAKQNFLDSKATTLEKYTDWISWLQDKEFHGSLTEADVNGIDYGKSTVREYLDVWIASPYSYGFEEYDEKTGTWIISLYEFSENYLEYISFLHVLRSVQRFKDTDDEDFILIHSYMWGNTDSDTSIKLLKGNSVILKEIPRVHIEEATVHFKAREKYLSEKYQD